MTETIELPLELKALVFWSSNPEIILSTEEVARKFSTHSTNVGVGLRRLCNLGLLERQKGLYERVSYETSYYKAGPALYYELGA